MIPYPPPFSSKLFPLLLPPSKVDGDNEWALVAGGSLLPAWPPAAWQQWSGQDQWREGELQVAAAREEGEVWQSEGGQGGHVRAGQTTGSMGPGPGVAPGRATAPLKSSPGPPGSL